MVLSTAQCSSTDTHGRPNETSLEEFVSDTLGTRWFDVVHGSEDGWSSDSSLCESVLGNMPSE
eukprot:3415793-Amphidinium_carterae.1